MNAERAEELKIIKRAKRLFVVTAVCVWGFIVAWVILLMYGLSQLGSLSKSRFAWSIDDVLKGVSVLAVVVAILLIVYGVSLLLVSRKMSIATQKKVQWLAWGSIAQIFSWLVVPAFGQIVIFVVFWNMAKRVDNDVASEERTKQGRTAKAETAAKTIFTKIDEQKYIKRANWLLFAPVLVIILAIVVGIGVMVLYEAVNSPDQMVSAAATAGSSDFVVGMVVVGAVFSIGFLVTFVMSIMFLTQSQYFSTKNKQVVRWLAGGALVQMVMVYSGIGFIAVPLCIIIPLVVVARLKD